MPSNDVACRAPVAEVRGRELAAQVPALRLGLPETDEPMGFGERQRPHQDVVGHGEGGGRHADAERRDQDDRGGEARRVAERAQRRSAGPGRGAARGRAPRSRGRRRRRSIHSDGATERTGRVAPAAREDGAHLGAVLGAEGRGVETQERAVHLRLRRGEARRAGEARRGRRAAPPRRARRRRRAGVMR